MLLRSGEAGSLESMLDDRQYGMPQETKQGEWHLTGNDVLLHAQQGAHSLLLYVRIIFLEIIREPKCNHGKPGVVVGTGLILFSKDDFFRAFEAMFPFFAMNIADAHIPSTSLERLAEESCILQAIFHHVPEAVKAEMDEVVVLRYDLGPWTGEIEGVRFLRASQVMKLENEVLGEVRLISPNDPAHAGVDEPKLMARRVDRLDSGKLKVPKIRQPCRPCTSGQITILAHRLGHE